MKIPEGRADSKRFFLHSNLDDLVTVVERERGPLITSPSYRARHFQSTNMSYEIVEKDQPSSGVDCKSWAEVAVNSNTGLTQNLPNLHSDMI